MIISTMRTGNLKFESGDCRIAMRMMLSTITNKLIVIIVKTININDIMIKVMVMIMTTLKKTRNIYNHYNGDSNNYNKNNSNC